MISRLLSIGCITFAILFAGLGYKPVSAETGYGWSPDENVPGYLDDTFTPFLLADRNRTVHAFTSQWIKENEGNKLAIVYRKWSLLGGWTRPVDIILSPIGGDANFLSAYMDSSDTMHVIFSATDALTRKTLVYYSNAPAANADWASAWSTPVLAGDGASGLNSAAIIGDNHDNLVVIYSGTRNGNGVYSIYSKDAGKNWSSPQLVITYASNLNAYSLRLTVGPTQKIRAAWNVVTSLGVDQALYFANFDSQKSKWDTPIKLDERVEKKPEYFGPSFPVIVDNGHEIVVMYNSGNPFSGRPVQAGGPITRMSMSFDDGVKWNGPLDPFPYHLGRSGENALTLDGNGTPHALFIQRIEEVNEGIYSSLGGIWHSVFINGVWSNPDRIVTSVAAHDVRAVISQGNVLLVIWREDPGSGASGIWYSYSVLDEPELPVLPLSTAPVGYSFKQGPVIVVSTNTPDPPHQLGLVDTSQPVNLKNNPALPIVVGIVPVVLILASVVLFFWLLPSRRR